MNELTGNPELFPILNKESLDEAMATVENEKPEVKLMMSMDEGSLREALGKIPSSKTITLHVVTSGGGGGDIGKLENTYHTDLNGNGIIGKAAGGPVYVGNAYLVGERGPELFLPGASGSIVPNNGIGGGNTYITIYQQPGQSAMALAEIIAYQASRQSTASAAGIKYAGR